MKKCNIIRVFAMALALVMCLAALPQPAQAALIRSRGQGVVTGKWSNEKFWRSGRYTYPFEFDNTLNSCTGFTLDYEIVEVSEGTMSGNFKFEIYVRKSNGSWKSVDTFYLNGLKATVDVKLKDPMSIDAVAVVCQKRANYSYSHAMTIRNAIYTGSSQKEDTSDDSVVKTPAVTGKKVTGDWSDTKFIRNGRTTYPFEFDNTLNRCSGFTLNYAITEVSSGNLDGNYKFAVYIRTTSGNWKYAKEFKMDGDSVSKKITFSPVSIDAVAVVCLKNGNYSYSYTFSITDPITK